MSSDPLIKVQPELFDAGAELARLSRDPGCGAVVTFSGLVRDANLGADVSGLFLEHYPGMTEESLVQIAEQAAQRWRLGRICIIHRVGTLSLGEQIVFVGTTSKHRQDAYESNQFLMDYLKVSAPFWKKEQTEQGEKWLDARTSDTAQAQQWQQESSNAT